QALDHVRKPILPGGVGALDQIGSKAQHAPYVWVNDGIATPPIPCRAAQRFEGQRLSWVQGQCDHAEALDAQPWQDWRSRCRGTELQGTVDALQAGPQIGSDGHRLGL